MAQAKSFIHMEASDSEEKPMLIEEGLAENTKKMDGTGRKKRILIALILVSSVAAFFVFATKDPAMKGNRRSPAKAAVGKKINRFTSDFWCDCDYIEVGELRNTKDDRYCLGVASTRRRRRKRTVATQDCDNQPHQTWCECVDGRIINGNNQCLRSYGDVDYCQESSDPVDFWDKYVHTNSRRRRFTDRSGVEQDFFQLQSQDDDLCLDIEGDDGTGATVTSDCSTTQSSDLVGDQWFYFRSRGTLVSSGKLVNKESSMCLEVASSDSGANIYTATCSTVDDSSQVWKLYDNGEIVSVLSGFCLEVEGTDGTGSIGAFSCEGSTDQLWTEVDGSGSAYGYSYFKNQLSNECLDIEGTDGDGNAETSTCTGQQEQYYAWKSIDWTTPQGSWTQVHCNFGGSYTDTISTKVSGSTTMTEEVASMIGVSIEAGVEVGAASYSASVYRELTQTLSTSWQSSWEDIRTKSVTCDSGFMWQFSMETSNGDGTVTWDTGYTACTTSCAAPTCPPNYEPHDDGECYQCSDDGCGDLTR